MTDNENVEDVAANEADLISDESLDSISGGKGVPASIRPVVREVDSSPADNEFIRRS